MIYEFEVLGKVVGKGRPRVNTYTGNIYTPNTTKDYENLIREYFLVNNKGFKKVIEGRVKISIIAYLKIPKSAKKSDIEGMLNNEISPLKKPDIDNIIKVVLDALNKFVINDDIQVSKIEAEKRYGLEEKIYIKIEEY